MIHEIELKNFRPHDHLKLKNLHPNLNVIYGDTGTGKTGILRALRLLLSNEPQSGVKLYKFIKDKKIGIKANVDNILIWRDDKRYTIKKDNKLALRLSAFGKKVPQPVKDIINLQDINWQLQIQPHFLVLENGGAIAKYLNPIMGSEESDLILEEIKKQTSTLRTNFKVLNSTISENEKICNKLQNIGEYKKELKILQDHILHQQATERLIFSISEKLFEIEKIDKQIVHPIKLNSFKKRMENIELKVANIYHLGLDVDRLEDKLNKFKKLKYISVKPHIEILEKIEEKNLEKNALQTDMDKLQSFLKSYKTLNEALEEGLKEYDKIKNKWDISFSKLKLCPFCNQRIKDAKDHTHN
jgi:chromosome segregation ATPase